MYLISQHLRELEPSNSGFTLIIYDKLYQISSKYKMVMLEHFSIFIDLKWDDPGLFNSKVFSHQIAI